MIATIISPIRWHNQNETSTKKKMLNSKQNIKSSPRPLTRGDNYPNTPR
ncbi:hypothetical protein KsCSTR_48340 [Candidatus Kuenenia stuttgartiensis]|uniref:Uncharacterized protein n=1 Tax=Kuenenia stuttgartiensis TaxID=174633 RepID=A0A6G7GXM2_KUEST|nr:hypothetical protein KsCSTR_48340 [Candidatus Kuenenia stuttgartiensis]